MQNELESTYPLLKIKLLSVNGAGHESGNSLMASEGELPLLQDVDANRDGQSDAWQAWKVVYRDVFILDGKNAQVGNPFNLTQHNLATETEYATLREMLLDAAMADQKPWMNPTVPQDVDLDGVVAPRDVLVTINTINRDGARELPPPTGTTLPTLRYDANGDNFVSSADVLLVINYINSHGNSGSAEGEGVPHAEGSGQLAANELLARSPVVVPMSNIIALAPLTGGAWELWKRDGVPSRSSSESESIPVALAATHDHTMVSLVSATSLLEPELDAVTHAALADRALSEMNWRFEEGLQRT